MSRRPDPSGKLLAAPETARRYRSPLSPFPARPDPLARNGDELSSPATPVLFPLVWKNIRDRIRHMPAKHLGRPVPPAPPPSDDQIRQWLSDQQETRKLRTNEIARAFDISLRQLQWWDERRVIEPDSKDGHSRKYTFEAAIVIGVLADLRKRGASLQELRRVLRPIERAIRRTNFRFEEFAVVTGPRVIFEDEPRTVCRLLAREQKLTRLVDLNQIARRLYERLQ